MNKSNLFDDLASAKRIACAKARTDKLVDHVSSLFLMHEANSVVIYSQRLAEQIPISHAAHAFNQFQRSMHLFEMIRLAALWDSVGRDRESIPTIIALFNKQELIEQIVEEAREKCMRGASPHDLTPSTDPEIIEAKNRWLADYRMHRATEDAEFVRRNLETAVTKATEVQKSPELKALRDLRDAYIAHNLDMPEPDLKVEATVCRLKYGDERLLLKKTKFVVDALHHGLNRTAHDWEGSRVTAREYAEALWNNCTFKIR